MTNKLQRVIPLVIFTIILAVVAFLLKEVFNSWLIHSTWMYLILFLGLQAVITFLITQSGAKKGGNAFVLHYLLAVVVRFVVSIIALFIVLKTHISEVTVFISNFIVLYFLYVAFEIYLLITNLRPNSEKRI